jgi:hypothetical protein
MTFSLQSEIKQVRQWDKFKYGWDGYRGRPIYKGTVDSAVFVLTEVEKFFAARDDSAFVEVEIGPQSDGCILLSVSFSKTDAKFYVTIDQFEVAGFELRGENEEFVTVRDAAISKQYLERLVAAK